VPFQFEGTSAIHVAPSRSVPVECVVAADACVTADRPKAAAARIIAPSRRAS